MNYFYYLKVYLPKEILSIKERGWPNLLLQKENMSQKCKNYLEDQEYFSGHKFIPQSDKKQLLKYFLCVLYKEYNL